MSILGAVGGAFSHKKTGSSLEQMLSPEQKKAMNMLSTFSSTGKFGDYKAGEAYGGKLGDYDLRGLEKAGIGGISDLQKAGTSEITQLGVQEIVDLLKTDKFDPYAKGGIYSGFKRNVLREQGEQSDKLRQLSALTGTLRSTGYEKEEGLLGERTSGQLTDKLAQLYDTFAQRKLAGAETAVGMGAEQQRQTLEREQAAIGAGSLERLLEDARAKEMYSDWLRKRGEMEGQINTASSLLSKNIPYGMKSISRKEPGTAMKMMGTTNAFMGSYNTAKYGYSTDQLSTNPFTIMSSFRGAAGGAGGSSGGAGGTGGSFL